MQNKKLEEILQKKADEIEVRPFSVVWEEIKDQLEEPQPQPKKTFALKKWLPFAMASVVMATAIVLTPIIIKSTTPPPAKVYYHDELTEQGIATLEDMFSSLSNSNITTVNFSKYNITNQILYITEDAIVKGAKFNLTGSVSATQFLIDMELFDKSVDLKLNLGAEYDSFHNVNSTKVYYKNTQSASPMYKYKVYAKHNNVQYMFEYTGVGQTDEFISFLNDFFQ